MRRYYQVIFIAVVTLLGLVSLGVFSWLAHKEWKRNFVALLGTVFLYVFVLTRASSIHHVDIWLQWRILGVKWNWILELGGIAVTLIGAAIALRRPTLSTRARGSGSAEGPDDAMGPRRYTFERGVLVLRPEGEPPSSKRQ